VGPAHLGAGVEFQLLDWAHTTNRISLSLKESAARKMSVITQKCPRRLAHQRMTWRREHARGEYDLGPPDGLLRYRGRACEAKEATYVLCSTVPWPGACVRSLASEILGCPGARGAARVHLWTLAKREGIIECRTVELIRRWVKIQHPEPTLVSSDQCAVVTADVF